MGKVGGGGHILKSLQWPEMTHYPDEYPTVRRVPEMIFSRLHDLKILEAKKD